jgi:hypothetical protein
VIPLRTRRKKSPEEVPAVVGQLIELREDLPLDRPLGHQPIARSQAVGETRPVVKRSMFTRKRPNRRTLVGQPLPELNELRGYLSQFAGTRIRVTSLSGDVEAADFAMELAEQLRRADWEVWQVGGERARDGLLDGIVYRCIGLDLSQHPWIEGLSTRLMHMGVSGPPQIQGDSGGLEIFVGRSGFRS